MTERSEQIYNLITGFSNQLSQEWEQYTTQAYNSNTKGAAYEKALARLLEDYFGGVYDIHTRTAIIDEELECFHVFDNPQQNEIDVVAVSKNSKPRLVFRVDQMQWVPYNSVPFICEVKSNLTTDGLRSDLEKTQKLRKLTPEERRTRTPLTFNRELAVEHQVLTLVYNDSERVSDSTLTQILSENLDSWDLVLLAQEDAIIVNPKMPIGSRPTTEDDLPDEAGPALQDTFDWILSRERSSNGLLIEEEGLLKFIFVLSVSIPYSVGVNSTATFEAMLRYKGRNDFLDHLENQIDDIVAGETEDISEYISGLGEIVDSRFDEVVEERDEE